MNRPTSVSTLYARILRKYRRLKIHAEESVANGSFYRYTISKRISIVRRLRRMLRKLRELETQLKLGTAAAAVVFMLHAGNTEAQTTIGPFDKENDARNPLYPPVLSNYETHPYFADLNGDGLIDLIVGDNYGNLFYYENQGTIAKALYVKASNADNPFAAIHPGDHAFPVLIDVDGDNDLDLFVTVPYSNPAVSAIHFFINGGTKFNPSFDASNDDTSLFATIHNGAYNAATAFADLDKDGDLDLILGSDASDSPEYALTYYEFDQGTGKYIRVTGPSDPFQDLNNNSYYGKATPAIVDVDGDFLLDVVAGVYDDGYPYHYHVLYLHNKGTATAPSFEWLKGAANPFDGIDTKEPSPSFADLDGDGDPDLILGQAGNYGRTPLSYYRNDAGTFNLMEDFDSPVGGALATPGSFGGFAAPAFFDMDDDGDLDVLLGNKYSINMKMYENAGTSFQNDPSTAIIGLLNAPDRTFYPAFGDVDGDGDIDLVVGYIDYSGYTHDAGIKFFRNESGTFIEDTPIIPAANTFNSGYEFRPTLGDVDGDGDMDIVTGYTSDPGQVRYFENDGTGNFTELTGPDNPFDFTISKYSVISPVLVDIDHDGDVDLFGGQYDFYSYISFLKNDGGTFVNQEGPDNPLSFIQHSYGSNINFADIDRDGDLDVFIGTYYGTLQYYENINPAPGTVASVSAADFTENDPAIVVDDAITIDDEDNDPTAFKAIIKITSGLAPGEDQLDFTSVGQITGSYDAITGALTLTGSDDMANYLTALQSVTYLNTSENPSATPREITFYVFDLDGTDPSLDSTPDGTVTVNITPVNDAPVLDVTGGITYTENDAATPFASAVTITDVDNTTMAGATVTITTNFTTGQDQLTFSTQNGITGNFSATTGVLTLTGSATLAQYQTALKAVGYLNTSDDPSSATRTVSIVVDDGTDLSNIATADIEVIPVEEPPVFNVIVYNAFSPDPDNLNPYFRIDNIENFPGNSVSIYNRWGDPVFNVSDYQNDDPGKRFEGFNKNGNALSSGAYFYEIQIPGLKTLTGYLILKR